MTDRIRGLIVTLDDDYREDDAETIVGALKMIKGVANVEMAPATSVQDYLNRQVVRLEMVNKMLDAIREEEK